MAGNEVKTVGELMSHPVVTVAPTATVAEAAAAMTGRQVGSVLVVDGADRAIGILTERDLIKLASGGNDPTGATVSDWMTKDPDTVTSETTVDDAFSSLSSHHYRHIPVVDDGKLVGIVSLRDLMRISQIIPVDKLTVEVPAGLEGVIVSDTTIGQVRGSEGFYHYRQYNAVELAAKRTFEDVWYLMYRGELPTLDERKAFMEEIIPLRDLEPELKEFLPLIVKAQGDHFRPLDAARAAYAIVCSGWPSWLDVGTEQLVTTGMRSCAVLPTLLMNLYRIHQGLDPVDPDPELRYAENYLYMLTGERPTVQFADAIEKYLISTIDHGYNASTFTSRVITSTGADLGGAVLGAMGALSGPLHGGAPSRALDMVDEIGSPENADAWIRAAIDGGSKLMGFGHRVYKTDDPRSVMLRGVAKEIGGPLFELAEHVEARAIAILEEVKPGRKLYTNVEFYGGLVMERVGLPRDMFTPTFTASRTVGWTANIIEQANNNRLIRPTSRYVGAPPPQPVPDAQ
jgi:citrate synthase